MWSTRVALALPPVVPGDKPGYEVSPVLSEAPTTNLSLRSGTLVPVIAWSSDVNAIEPSQSWYSSGIFADEPPQATIVPTGSKEALPAVLLVSYQISPSQIEDPVGSVVWTYFAPKALLLLGILICLVPVAGSVTVIGSVQGAVLPV